MRHQWNSGVRHVLEVKYSSDNWFTAKAVCVLSGGRRAGETSGWPFSFLPHRVSMQFPGNITEIRTKILLDFLVFVLYCELSKRNVLLDVLSRFVEMFSPDIIIHPKCSFLLCG